MDLAAYAAEAAVEVTHWVRWSSALFSDIIKGLGPSQDSFVLDVGTGTGYQSPPAPRSGFSRVAGIDRSPEAIRFCAEKRLGEVRMGDACGLPLPERAFDLIFATDVIEHVDDDRSALRGLRRVLKPGRHLLLTVPAFPLLWLQRDVSHDKCRYWLNQLLDRLHDENLSPRQEFYFNYLLLM
jgi:SAM-dependent methyltransferase